MSIYKETESVILRHHMILHISPVALHSHFLYLALVISNYDTGI
jgi:hypothetical protein